MLHFRVTHDLRVNDLQSLQDKVRLSGGHLIAYAEVISLLIISARSYRVKWVATKEEIRSTSFHSMLITGLLGWWALPGPYWSLSAIIFNFHGGFDVTDALLRAHQGNPSLLGYSEAKALAASQDKARRLARVIFITLILLIVGFLIHSIRSLPKK